MPKEQSTVLWTRQLQSPSNPKSFILTFSLSTSKSVTQIFKRQWFFFFPEKWGCYFEFIFFCASHCQTLFLCPVSPDTILCYQSHSVLLEFMRKKKKKTNGQTELKSASLENWIVISEDPFHTHSQKLKTIALEVATQLSHIFLPAEPKSRQDRKYWLEDVLHQKTLKPWIQWFKRKKKINKKSMCH